MGESGMSPARAKHEAAQEQEAQGMAEEDESAVEKGKAVLAKAKSRKEWFDQTHLGRTLKQVSEGNGNLLAGGIAYLSLTSLAAALVIAITLSTYMVHFNAGWNDAFYGFIDDTIPGVIKSGPSDSGLVDPSTIEPQALTGVVGIVSFLILINTATRYLSALRLGTLAMLGRDTLSPAKGKLRDLGVLVALIIVVLLGVALQVLASSFSESVANLISDQPLSQWIIRLPAFVVGVAVDMAFVALAIVVLGRFKRPRKALVWTLVIAAVAIGILRQAVSLVVGGVADNPVLAGAAAIITIMIFVNFIARIILYAAAWLGVFAQASDAGASAHHPDVEVAEMGPMAERGHGTVTTKRAVKRHP